MGQNKLRFYREKAKLTQTQLAYEAGVSQRYIAFIETGERVPSLLVAAKMAKALKTRMDDIFLL